MMDRGDQSKNNGDNEIYRWHEMIEINNKKSNMFMEHVNNMSIFVKKLNKNIKNVDIETNEIKKKFEYYEMEQKKYWSSNETLEKELGLLKSSIFANYHKQKNIIINLRKENNDFLHQIKLLKQNNEEVHRLNIEKDNQLSENRSQLNLFQKRLEETKISYESNIKFSEDKMLKIIKQFELKIKEIQQIYKNELNKMEMSKDQEIMILKARNQTLLFENEKILLDLHSMKELISVSKENALHSSNTELFENIKSLNDENIKLRNKTQLQDTSIIQLICRIKELQSHVKQKEKLSLPWVNSQSICNEVTAIPSDLEQQIYKLKKATYHCIESIEQNLKH